MTPALLSIRINPYTQKRINKAQSVTKWNGYGKCKYGVIYTIVECLCCREVEALEYYNLMGVRYSSKNAVTQIV